MAQDDSVRLRGTRERTIFRLLHRLARIHLAQMLAGIHARGFTDVMPSYPTLLSNLDSEGTRLALLAARAGVSRQAAGQLLSEIEAKGYVERVDDPDDGRGVIIRFTAKGSRLLAAALASVQEIEEDYARRVGRTRLVAAKDTLAALLSEIDPDGTLGK
jgi:DNA-binding MarR family transcriptional regulator